MHGLCCLVFVIVRLFGLLTLAHAVGRTLNVLRAAHVVVALHVIKNRISRISLQVQRQYIANVTVKIHDAHTGVSCWRAASTVQRLWALRSIRLLWKLP